MHFKYGDRKVVNLTRWMTDHPHCDDKSLFKQMPSYHFFITLLQVLELDYGRHSVLTGLTSFLRSPSRNLESVTISRWSWTRISSNLPISRRSTVHKRRRSFCMKKKCKSFFERKNVALKEQALRAHILLKPSIRYMFCGYVPTPQL